MRRVGLAKRIVVAIIALTFITALVPNVAAVHYCSKMSVHFNPAALTDPSNHIWQGTISGDINGIMTFWATGPIPSKDLGHPPEFFWQVHFFTEYWMIETDDGWIAGIDKGNTGYSNWYFRMNGEVTEAGGIYADLIGHKVHMNGEIYWTDVFVEGVAEGPVIIN